MTNPASVDSAVCNTGLLNDSPVPLDISGWELLSQRANSSNYHSPDGKWMLKLLDTTLSRTADGASAASAGDHHEPDADFRNEEEREQAVSILRELFSNHINPFFGE